MRVYLPTGQQITGEKPGKKIFAKGFHNLADELAQKWVDEGAAKPATEDNMVVHEGVAMTAEEYHALPDPPATTHVVVTGENEDGSTFEDTVDVGDIGHPTMAGAVEATEAIGALDSAITEESLTLVAPADEVALEDGATIVGEEE